MKKNSLSLFLFTLLPLTGARQVDTTQDSQFSPENPAAKAVVLKFVPGEDMFYVPFYGYHNRLEPHNR